MSNHAINISCIILAGGEGKRAQGMDKGLVLYNDRPLIEHVIDAIEHQVDDIVISANRNIETYGQYVSQVITDSANNYQGPLAGIAASLPFCKHELVLVVACDMPTLPANLVERLAADVHNASICIASVDGHHQLAMIIKKDLLDSIRQRLNDDQLKLIRWVESVDYNTVNFDDIPLAFINLNHLSNGD